MTEVELLTQENEALRTRIVELEAAAKFHRDRLHTIRVVLDEDEDLEYDVTVLETSPLLMVGIAEGDPKPVLRPGWRWDAEDSAWYFGPDDGVLEVRRLDHSWFLWARGDGAELIQSGKAFRALACMEEAEKALEAHTPGAVAAWIEAVDAARIAEAEKAEKAKEPTP